MRRTTVNNIFCRVGLPALILTMATVGCSNEESGSGDSSGGGASGQRETLTLDLGNGVAMKLAFIPAGKFMMGSPAGEKGRFDDECPQHDVMISKPFYMGVYEVTQEQYEQIMGANPSSFKGKTNPADTVSWEDAMEFCRKLSAKTGRIVTLPTEARWEYACRAGTKTRFSYGDDEGRLGEYAWYMENSKGKTHEVGGKKPNNFGLYDMHGNVWEWCSDRYADSYASAGKVDPTGPASGSDLVLRGGGWGKDPRNCRSANRSRHDPGDAINTFGFRVVVELK